MDTVTSASKAAEQRRDIIMKTVNILIPMHLAGQGETNRRHSQAGYAMAALLVGMAVLAVMMTVAMPVWKQMVQREKEAELVFRGEQIARSIGLFQRKFANAYPPTLDVLVEQKFLRKKYKDPITGEDFVPLTQGQTQAGTPGGQPNTQRGGTPQTNPPGAAGRGSPFAPSTGTPGAGTPGGAPAGGIVGVTSKSKDVSIRLYNGRSHYNEWAFVYTPPATAAGRGGTTGPGGVGGTGGPGGVGGTGPRGGGGSGPPGGGGGRPFPGGPGAPPGGPGRPGPGGPGGGGSPFTFPTGPGRR